MSDKNRKELTEAELEKAAGGASDSPAMDSDRSLTDPPSTGSQGDLPHGGSGGEPQNPTGEGPGRGSIG